MRLLSMRRAVVSNRARGPVGADPTWETVREIYRTLRRVTQRALTPHELLLSEYHALVLCERGPVPLKSITETLGVTPAATTDIVRRLGDRRLLRFSSDSRDRRSRIANLTSEGRRRLAKARAAHTAALRTLGVRISPEARRGLRQGLAELNRALAESGMA